MRSPAWNTASPRSSVTSSMRRTRRAPAPAGGGATGGVSGRAHGGEGHAAGVRRGPAAGMLDLGMPGMDGYKLARGICDRLPRRPLLVAVTGHSELARQSRDEGFDEHFLKPVDPAALMAFLAAHAATKG